MADVGESEKAGLGTFVKKQTKYGTTKKAFHTNEFYMKHYVKQNDTLQGLALKYGVTMEHLKRANNIWTNDSLFLREYLLIPLIQQSAQKLPVLNGGVQIHSRSENCSSDGEIVTKQDLSLSSRSHKVPEKTECAISDVSISTTDYLSQFDSSLAKIRSNVQKLEETTNFPEDSTNPLNFLPYKRTTFYGHRHKSRSMDFTNPLMEEPRLEFKSHMNQAGQHRSSMEQLQKTDEEMFKL